MSDNHIFEFLDTVGDGSGTVQMTGNYSVTPDDFFFQSTGYAELHRIIVHIEDGFGMGLDEYGNLGSALTNGFELKTKENDNTLIKDLTGGITIKKNADFGRFCYDFKITQQTAGTDVLSARWTFTKAGAPLRLSDTEKLVITLNDDFSNLTDHTFMVQGIYK